MSNAHIYSQLQFSYEITPEAKSLFQSAVASIDNVIYEPVAMCAAKDGLNNYSFLCNGIHIEPSATPFAAMITLDQDQNGAFGVSHIQKLSY
ncbi:hypothetical protein [Pseudoalteromonas tunicata]|jgi:hypothetical protein|uniref:Uncharacterized protein n=1 Tax=Pseudoalteromonas tunicata D2 TaxID=87626 RepID=A4CC04_9GAMM|nr:hypothetical protein [Pseudoalteromonas tunicata]ATC94439.1 hypothetical protein PTUN_a1871 [Pseudoalteromonas tunicata]AXT30171.1 hypothetical protein D1819_04690 [Pseudoalteromonas tunicata]EAR27891.1 hypothetical protein PTD2_18755 [Pseudoalteromonas tunicata D2]MDP4984118.1 hypothetical protein [Pseudoalteromonas tunicata]MDP5211655.1 hypothetical protein [Pseudoalteromonas tunicata]